MSRRLHRYRARWVLPAEGTAGATAIDQGNTENHEKAIKVVHLCAGSSRCPGPQWLRLLRWVGEVEAWSDSLQGRPRHKLIVGKAQTAMTTKATTSTDSVDAAEEDEGNEWWVHT